MERHKYRNCPWSCTCSEMRRNICYESQLCHNFGDASNLNDWLIEIQYCVLQCCFVWGEGVAELLLTHNFVVQCCTITPLTTKYNFEKQPVSQPADWFLLILILVELILCGLWINKTESILHKTLCFRKTSMSIPTCLYDRPEGLRGSLSNHKSHGTYHNIHG